MSKILRCQNVVDGLVSSVFYVHAGVHQHHICGKDHEKEKKVIAGQPSAELWELWG